MRPGALVPAPVFAALFAALLAAAGPARAAIEISGRVQAEDGAPLAGAAVELRRVEDTYTGVRRTWTGEAAPALVRAVADRDGFYTLRAPGPGMYDAQISAGGRVLLEITALPLVGTTVLPPAVAVAAAETPVRVVDAAGKPVAGAVVQPAEESVDVVVPTWRPGWPMLRSGADGRVSIALPALPRKAAPTRWTATAAGFAPRWVEIGGPLSVALVPAAPAAELRVREADGRPVAGAIVATVQDDLPLAVTGADGSARLPRAAGPLEVLAADGRVWKSGPPRAARPAPARSPARARAPVPLPESVTLPPPVALAGGVVDAEDRTPLAGAVVASNADLGRWTVADARGSYALGNPGEGRLGLMVWAAGHFRGDAPVTAPGRGPTVVLLPGAMVTGWVIDPGRHPIPAAAVVPSLGRSADFRLRDRYVLAPAASGRDGGFSLLVPPRLAATLEARASGYASRSVALPALAAHGRPAAVTLVLDAGHALIGRVIDAGGAPVAGAEVEALVGLEGFDLYTSTFAGSRRRPSSHAAVTGEQGAFRLEHLAAGRVAVVASKPGFAPAVLPGVTVAAAEPATDLGSVRLLPGAALEGVVSDGHRPLAGAKVALRLSTQSALSSATATLAPIAADGDGAFRFADLAPGTTVDLEVSHPGFEHRTLSKVAAPTERPLKIVLARATQIAGRVLAEDRTPVAGAWVRPDAEDHRFPMPERMRASGTTDEDGAFLLDGAPSGRVRLEVTAKGFESGKLDGLEVAPGGRLEGVEVVLKRGAAVAGTVTTEDGLPVAGAYVSAAGAGAATDGDGAYRLEGVPQGRQRITATSTDLGSTSEQAEVGPGETRVDLRFAAGVTVQGQVVDRAGAPAAGVPVALQPRAYPGRWENGESDAQGGFRFDHVAAGSYQVSAGRGPWAAGAARPVEVGAEPVAGIVLTYDRHTALSGRIAGVRQEDLATLKVEAQSDRASSVPGEIAADGSYRIEGLAAGDWLVTATAGATGRRGQGRITLGEGAEESHLDLTLGSGLTLQGIVRWNGRPVDGARVDVASGDGRLAQSDSTDHLGAFRIEGLAPGLYQLGVRDLSTELRDVRIVDLREDQTVAVDLVGGAVAGVLVDGASGGPLAGAEAHLEAPGGMPVPGGQTHGSDAQGHVGFDPIAAGAYVLVVSKPGYATQSIALSVEPGATATLAVTLLPAPAGEAPPPATPPPPPRSAPASRSAPRP